MTDPTDWGIVAQRAAEEHLALCEEWRAYYEDESGDPPAKPDPTFAPYDSCDTCLIRETLHASWPSLVKGFKALLDPDDPELVGVLAQAVRDASAEPWPDHLVPADRYARAVLTALRQAIQP